MTKKEKKSVVGLRPTTSNSPLRGQNQDYGGVGVKNDNADYTISDEHIHDMSKVAHQPEWEVETPKTRKAIAKKLGKETDPEGKERMKKPLRKVTEGRTLRDIKEMLELVHEGNVPEPRSQVKNYGLTDDDADKLSKVKAMLDKEKKPAKPVKEEVEHIDEARGRPKKDAASDSADEHPMMQARKVISTRGQHPFTFADGKKHQMNPMTAHRILAHHDNLHTPAEKEAFASRIHKSAESLHNWMHGKSDDEELPKISLGGGAKVGGLGGRSRPTISGMKPGKKK